MSLMSRVALAVVVLFGMQLSAQDAADAERKHRGSDDGKSVSVTGCLQKGAGADEFTITGDDGKAYELKSSSSINLSEHVGHKVTITGKAGSEAKEQTSATSPSAAAPTEPSGASSERGKSGKSAGSTAMNQLNVTDLKMVSTSCP